jgi:dihydrofolate reductase
MGKLIVHMFVTLDGVYQAPGEPDEDLDGGFQLGGWQAPYLDAESGRLMFDEMASLDALLLGRKTYAIFANYWPNAPAEVPFTGLLNATQKYVASRTLQAADWDPTTIIRQVPEDVARLKDEHQEVHVSGSGDLVHTLLREELVDRLNLWIYPVVLAGGKRLFDGGPMTNAWRLATCTPFATGVVHLGYELAGAPVYGDTGLDAAGGDWPPKPSRAVLEKTKRPADPDA